MAPPPDRREIDAVLARELPRVRAMLIGQLRDFDRAQDLAQESALQALEHWPIDGVPAVPAAWLLTVARRRAIDAARRRRTAEAASEQLQQVASDEVEPPTTGAMFDDDLLRLVFTCCHPALPVGAQVLLTLRAVAGSSIGELARAFLTSEDSIDQRLTRAKRKIRLSGIPYATPRAPELTARIDGVLRVIYLIYNEGYCASSGATLTRDDLAREAITLARHVVRLLPREPEVLALLALLLLHDARSGARTTADGRLVLLADQDRSRWNRAQIVEGRGWLEHALAQRRAPGPYQVQAAVAALHADATTAAATDWPQIAALYDYLLRFDDSPVVRLNRAVAVAMSGQLDAGLAQLDALGDALADFHPFHAARAALRLRAGNANGALADYRRAAAVAAGSGNLAERRFLAETIGHLEASASI